MWLPTKGAGISLSSWSLARRPWEKHVLFPGKVLQGEIPAQPGRPHSPPGPWCSGVSLMLWGQAGCRASGAGRWHGDCTLLAAFSQAALVCYSMCPHSSRKPSPKPSKGILHSPWVREGLPQSWSWPRHLPGANFSLRFLAVAPNELSWGSPKPCRQSWDEDFTAWGHRQAQGVMLGPCAGFSSLPWQQGACRSATPQ